MKHIIEVKNLTWKYDKKTILSDINLSIARGTLTGIIGPNGSGKTTLLKNISSVLKPQRGSVFIEGKDILDYSARQLAQKMAFVPQNTNMDFDFTALDVVLMGRNPHLGRFQEESQEDIEIAQNAMRMTRTLEFQDRKITTLSGGERQRVIIARAIAQETDIILMDEPISNLDIRHQVDILNLIQDLVQNHGKTIITVLHDLNLAAHFCEEVLLLKNGRIYSKGTPKEVLTPDTVKDVYEIKVKSLNPFSDDTPHLIPYLSK